MTINLVTSLRGDTRATHTICPPGILNSVVSERTSKHLWFFKEEKRRMKEEIERRRAEAAEKRQKMPEDGVSEDKKPFKCFSPKGSSLKVTSPPASMQDTKINGAWSPNQWSNIKINVEILVIRPRKML